MGETVHIQEVCEGKMLLNKPVIRFVSVVQILYTKMFKPLKLFVVEKLHVSKHILFVFL